MDSFLVFFFKDDFWALEDSNRHLTGFSKVPKLLYHFKNLAQSMRCSLSTLVHIKGLGPRGGREREDFLQRGN